MMQDGKQPAELESLKNTGAATLKVSQSMSALNGDHHAVDLAPTKPVSNQ